MGFVYAAALLIAALGFFILCIGAFLYLLAQVKAFLAVLESNQREDVKMKQGHLTCDLCTNEWDLSWPSYIDPTTLRVECPNCKHVQSVEI